MILKIGYLEKFVTSDKKRHLAEFFYGIDLLLKLQVVKELLEID